MKIEQHSEDEQDYSKTIADLAQGDIVTRRKVIEEACVLAATNALNYALHTQGKLSEQSDIKHNRMEGTLKRDQPLPKSDELAELHRSLEELKYRVVHGKSKSLEDVHAALTLYRKIRDMVMNNA